MSVSPVSPPTTPATPGAPAQPDPQLPARTPLTLLQWIAIALGVAVFVSACISLGRWQFSRHEARDEVIHTIVANYDSKPRALTELVSAPDAPLADSDVWAVAEVSGSYVPQYTALLRNRPINSTPSVHALVPFLTDEGTVLLVNRGWVPYDNGVERPSRIPDPPAGSVTITVHLRATEPSSKKDAPVGQVQSINVFDAFAAGAEYSSLEPFDPDTTYTQVYGSLRSESPEPAEPVNSLPRPSTDPKSHLSYAMQWWVFALGGLAGLGVLIVREVRGRSGKSQASANPFATLAAAQVARDLQTSGDSEPGVSADPGTRNRRKRAVQTEEDYEDSLFSDE